MGVACFESVRKTYRRAGKHIVAVDCLSMSLNEGEIVGLVGPNGAGKSTLVKLLCGILSPTEGDVRTLGFIPSRQRQALAQHIGVVFGQRSSLWYNIPALESMLLMRDIYSIPRGAFSERLHEYSRLLGADHLLSVPVRKLSLGERMRCELLATVLHHPRLLILDEPTIGLDIAAKSAFREVIRNMASGLRTTVLLTTHDLQDVEKVCDRVVLINKGQKELDLALSELLGPAQQHVTIEVEEVPGAERLRESPFYREVRQGWLAFYLPRSRMSEFLQNVVDQFGDSARFRTGEPNLEDILYSYYHETA
jgi:ABC-2 type transport system ATP-binding protein